jgi:CheY-like chemotaxis protein
MSAVQVLLFDEEPILRRATALMLGARGATVVTARTVDELVALANKRIYDVAVVDVPYDGPSGAEIVARLRAGGLLPRRIVVCAAAPVERREAELFTQVIVKPYPFGQLVTAVFGSANRRRPTRSGVFSRVRARLPRLAEQGHGAAAQLVGAQTISENENRRGALRLVEPLADVVPIAGRGSRARRPAGEPATEARSPGVSRPPRRAVRVRRGRG